MSNKVTYKKGDVINNLVFIEETLPYIEPNRLIKYKKAIFQCFCGNHFETRISAIKQGGTKSCGCLIKRTTPKTKKTNGAWRNPLFVNWVMIKNRCLNPNNNNYKYYGARGISIFPIWQVDFISFYDYVSALPNFRKEEYSLDRINNDGNYEPGNLRWAPRSVQNKNRRTSKNNTSGHKGIYPYKGKWRVRFQLNEIIKEIGLYGTIEEALIKRDEYETRR